MADFADFNRRVLQKDPVALRAIILRTQYGAFETIAPFAAKFERPRILETRAAPCVAIHGVSLQPRPGAGLQCGCFQIGH